MMTTNGTTYPHPIKLMALDIDGTLLNSKLELSERNEAAIKAAISEGVQVILATGKTRNAGIKLVERLGITSPGIYSQGLIVYEADGRIRYQNALDPAAARQIITFGEDRGFKFYAYSGDRILARRADRELTAAIVKYHEPEPDVVGPLQNLLDRMPFNKLMALGEPRAITALRWQLNAQLGASVRMVQAAIPEMLEILPAGASKGAALRMLHKDMAIPAENVMAIGDAENDIEMLQVAGLGVAIGNAEQKLKDVAQVVVASNDEDGVAEAIERYVLQRKLPQRDSGDADKMIDVPAADARATAPAATGRKTTAKGGADA